MTRVRFAAHLVTAALLLAAAAAEASPYIEVRFSVKIIRDPATHARPPVNLAGAALTDLKLYGVFEVANDSLLATYSRGYRFTLAEIFDIGTCTAACDSSDPSFWSAATLTGDWDMKNFERWAKLYPAFLWRSNMVNIYVNAGKGDGAVASFPPPDPRSNDVVFVGSRCFDPADSRAWAPALVHHEMGHYFSLPHPNGSIENCCVPASCITDGDQIEDTLPDGPCFTLDQISTHRYGQPFSGVDAAKQDSLLNMFWNNMCYLHPDQKDDPGEGFGQILLPRLTEMQLDQWTDAANGIRAPVRTAKTQFVEPQACGICPPPTGSSSDPYRSVPAALAGAGAGDILMLRPGTYTGPFTINQPVTLRATRRGVARVTN